MFLHAKTLAQSHPATYSETGTAEHLFALIDLCELIERHKKFIVNRAQSSRRTKNRGFLNGTEESDAEFGRRPLLTERYWPQLAHIHVRVQTARVSGILRKVCSDLQ
jgi:hypothetical protein